MNFETKEVGQRMEQQNVTIVDFPCTNYFNEKKNERMRNGSNNSTEEEFYCSSCSSDNDSSESITFDTRKLWHDLAHLIKCIYRETNREFAENHSTNDLCKAKEYVQILTQTNAEALFKKIESILLEYVDEIRNQVLKRSQTSLKASNDVQLFISYLLDEYNTFIQAAKNVASIVSYLEDHYMKTFHLTWLLYNKYLYEKFVYMDKKIQQAMSIMIDLLQPTNDNQPEYSPAEYTQLLNRFLAFDEEMSEIACLYKDCQVKMTSIGRNSLTKNRNPTPVISKKQVCKKVKQTTNKSSKTKENVTSSTSNAVDIPSTNNSNTNPSVSLQEDSHGSSISSGLGEKESSSISSFDEYSAGNNTTSSSYTKEEPEQLETNPEPVTETNAATKKSKSTRRKESANASKPSSIVPDLILPPKPPSKLQADFRPLTIPLLTKTEIPACPSVRPAQLQSVSFTAGTFGSITTTTNPISTTRPHLNLSLSKKADSTVALNNFGELLRQVTAPNEISALLSTLGANDDSYKEKKCDFCCCDFHPDSNHSSSSSLTSNHCVTCMSLPNPMAMSCMFSPRDTEAKERLQLKLNKRTIQQNSDPPKSLSSSSSTSTTNKNKGKPCDNNIDDLVRYIDGDETTSIERTSKKKKKKKSTPKNPTVVAPVEPAPAPIEDKPTTSVQMEESSTIETHVPPSPPVEKRNPTPTAKIESTPETNPLSPEEEVNWITISRKQTKHKPTSIPSLLAVPVAPPSNSKPKQSPKSTKRKPSSNNPTVAQEKVISETVTNSKKPQTTAHPARPQTKGKTDVPSAWTTHETTPVPPVASASTLLATAPAFVPSASLLISNNLLPPEQPNSSLYWNRDGYLLPPPPPPPGPVQRPNSAFSAAPGPRCIRRPSPEPPTTSFPTYSPLNYTVGNSTSTWKETSETNGKESQWKYPYEEQQPPSSTTTTTIPDDFPLYDPFNSGAGLTISPALLLNNGLKDNDIDEMNALDREIEDFKKCYIDTLSFDSPDTL